MIESVRRYRVVGPKALPLSTFLIKDALLVHLVIQ